MKQISTRTAEISFLKKDFVKMTMKENSLLEIRDMIENHDAENIISGNRPHVILIDTRLNSLSSDEARRYSSGTHPTKYRYAVAILFKGLAGRITANSLLKNYKPKVLTKIFTDENKAVLWLDNILKAREQNPD